MAGHTYALIRCSFGVAQATQQRGRVSTKVRFGPVELLLSVPEDDTLLDWAATPQKRLPAELLFRDTDGGGVLETLRLEQAYCVAYAEQFISGDAGSGAYQCLVTLSDPSGWTLTAGGPASTFVAPAAREHGVPASFERESLPDFSSLKALVQAGGAFGDALPASILACFTIDEPAKFRRATLNDLGLIYATATGRKLLESLSKSGKKVEIVYSMSGNSMLRYDAPASRFMQSDGALGGGTSSMIGYNPAKEYVSDAEWGTRPPAIGLAHELIHAEQAAYGRMSTGRADNDGRMDGGNPARPVQEDIRELEAVGIPPQDDYPFSENKIRSEWNPPQPERKWY
ncbi:MAG: M91 family zinc metallopeptidase [Bacteroidota bacterium]|nr:M91 family zinc metallopeptidase [Bacteroidota bacterium]